MLSFLNELSLPKDPDPLETIKNFELLGDCYRRVAQAGIKEIKIHSSFYAHEFSPGYSFFKLIEDGRVDPDLRTLLKSAVGIVPYIDELLSLYEEENRAALEMKYEEELCIGLGLASDKIFNTVAFSFLSERWNIPECNISISQLSENDEGNIAEIEEEAITRNISTLTQAEFHAGFIAKETTSAIESGKELWLRRSELFPNLEFCEQVKGQLASYHYNTPGFQLIIQRLLMLQRTALKFDGNPVKPDDFRTLASRESATRLRDFINELTVLCPDGNYRLFDWHVRFTPGAGRIHFFPLEDQKKIIVGSIANQNTIK